MKKITYLFILFLGIAFTGCQEEKGFLFQDVTRISFSPKEAGNYEMTYSFIWGTQNRDTVYLPVSISGRVADHDRQIEVVQIPGYDVTYNHDDQGHLTDSIVTEWSNSAVAGKHYIAFEDAEAKALLEKADADQGEIDNVFDSLSKAYNTAKATISDGGKKDDDTKKPDGNTKKPTNGSTDGNTKTPLKDSMQSYVRKTFTIGKKLTYKVTACSKKGKTVTEIAEDLEEPAQKIEQIYKAALKYNANEKEKDKIYAELN